MRRTTIAVLLALPVSVFSSGCDLSESLIFNPPPRARVLDVATSEPPPPPPPLVFGDR